MSKTRASVFISSLNGYELEPGRTLSDVRGDLRAEIEKRFPFLKVNINEEWEAAGAGNPRRTTEDLSRECDLFLGILVDNRGFAGDDNYSATHTEFIAAMNDSAEKMLVFVQERLGDRAVAEAQEANYPELLKTLGDYETGKILNFFEGEKDLLKEVDRAIVGFCADSLRQLRKFPAYASEKTSTATEWELMTFTERHEAMLEKFKERAKKPILGAKSRVGSLTFGERGPSAIRYDLELKLGRKKVKLPVLLTACPDRFSYADAARYVGYPFRSAVEDWKEKRGPLHIVAVARTITDTQIRKHLGNPDIHVLREDWGFFAADPERFIQVAYLTNCISPPALPRNLARFLAWMDSYRQLKDLVSRAEIRGGILKARSRA